MTFQSFLNIKVEYNSVVLLKASKSFSVDKKAVVHNS